MRSEVVAAIKSLKGFKSVGKDQYEARCPAHDDKRASLSIGRGKDNEILLHCHAGCTIEAILSGMGLEKKDLFAENENGDKSREKFNVVSTFDYRTVAGELSYQVCKLEPKDFRQRRPDGNGGFIWNIKNLKRLPYNLPELKGAEYVFIVEGEKDVESLRNIGLTATCNAGGAGKWTAELNQYFRPDQHITIIPDNDEPGRKHAEQVAKSLHGKVASIKILNLEGLQEKQDVSDWLQGRDPETAAEELSRLSDAAQEWEPPKETESRIIVDGGRNVSGDVRDFVDSIEGTFTTAQLYNELSLHTTEEKTAARQTLFRMKGKTIQAHGNHAGTWRVIRGDVAEMNFDNLQTDELDLWLPFDLHNEVTIMPGNVIVVAGDADAGKTAFLLNAIQRNIQKWDCHYFNSEMGAEELYKRLKLFADFPIKDPHFHAYERSDDFQDVIQPGKYSLNIVDFLEVTDEFYKVAGYISQIHRCLGEAVAIIAIQKRSRESELPLGGARALEKPRLVITLNGGSKSAPNKVTILKAKNRKTEYSLNGLSRNYKLIKGSEFRCDSPTWS